MTSLRGQVALLTGGTRGIGRAMALQLAQSGVHIALAAKSDVPHPTLPGTLGSVCTEIQSLGVEAIGIRTDVREASQIEAAVQETVDRFGRLDIVIHNAGALQLSTLTTTPLKHYDLMQSINERALFVLAQASIPHLLKAPRPHLLALSPPINLRSEWLGKFIPYTVSKYGMSLLMAGLAAELTGQIACNTLWPRTVIATAATERFAGEAIYPISRTPAIMADALMALLAMSPVPNGQHWLDEDILKRSGKTDFSCYRCQNSEQPLQLDFYVDE